MDECRNRLHPASWHLWRLTLMDTAHITGITSSEADCLHLPLSAQARAKEPLHNSAGHTQSATQQGNTDRQCKHGIQERQRRSLSGRDLYATQRQADPARRDECLYVEGIPIPYSCPISDRRQCEICIYFSRNKTQDPRRSHNKSS